MNFITATDYLHMYAVLIIHVCMYSLSMRGSCLKQLNTESRQHGSLKLAEGSTCYKEQPPPLVGVVTPTLLEPTKPQKVDLPSKTITKDKGMESRPTENQQVRNLSTKTGDTQLYTQVIMVLIGTSATLFS